MQELKTRAISMLTEAVLDGSQAMRDPVGGSVEFHFVPILKLINTLLIMGIFNDEDTKHILKMIDPNVFSGKEDEEEKEKAEGGSGDAKGEDEEEAEEELEDEGVGEDEEEEELKKLEKGDDEGEEEEPKEGGEAAEGKVGGEKVAEEKEAEAVEAEVKDEEEGLEEGLLQMKLPESVKLQVSIISQQLPPHAGRRLCRLIHLETSVSSAPPPLRCARSCSTSATASCGTAWRPSWPTRTSSSTTSRATSAFATTC